MVFVVLLDLDLASMDWIVEEFLRLPHVPCGMCQYGEKMVVIFL